MTVNKLMRGLAVAAFTVAVASAEPADQQQLRQAVEKSVTALLPGGPGFVKVSGCVSCHNNTLPLMAASLARSRGLRVDSANETLQKHMLISFAGGVRQAMLETSYAVPDTQVSVPYILQALKAEGMPADDMTSIAIHAIAAKQLPDGHWPSYINRAPIENGDIQATALSVRAIQLYGMPGRAAEWKERTAKAREWLTQAKAQTLEDKIMLVAGLGWSDANKDQIAEAARDLLAQQRPDGGFAQLPTLEADAYATGKALVALHEAGVLRPGDSAYQKGLAYLLKTQEADGTWHVRSRAFPFQPLKESGFPHGRNQWISAAGTSWASMALAYALEPPKTVALREYIAP